MNFYFSNYLVCEGLIISLINMSFQHFSVEPQVFNLAFLILFLQQGSCQFGANRTNTRMITCLLVFTCLLQGCACSFFYRVLGLFQCDDQSFIFVFVFELPLLVTLAVLALLWSGNIFFTLFYHLPKLLLKVFANLHQMTLQRHVINADEGFITDRNSSRYVISDSNVL